MAVSVERVANYFSVSLNGRKKEDNLARVERVLAPVFVGAWMGVLASIVSENWYYMNGFGFMELGILGESIRQGVIGWRRRLAEESRPQLNNP